MMLLYVVVAWTKDAQLPQIQLCGAYHEQHEAVAHVNQAQPLHPRLTFDIRVCPFPEQEQIAALEPWLDAQEEHRDA